MYIFSAYTAENFIPNRVQSYCPSVVSLQLQYIRNPPREHRGGFLFEKRGGGKPCICGHITAFARPEAGVSESLWETLPGNGRGVSREKSRFQVGVYPATQNSLRKWRQFHMVDQQVMRARMFDDDRYQTMFILNNKKQGTSPVFVKASKDAETESKWQLIHHKTLLLFRTYSEVCAYCREHGRM